MQHTVILSKNVLIKIGFRQSGEGSVQAIETGGSAKTEEVQQHSQAASVKPNKSDQNINNSGQVEEKSFRKVNNPKNVLKERSTVIKEATCTQTSRRKILVKR